MKKAGSHPIGISKYQLIVSLTLSALGICSSNQNKNPYLTKSTPYLPCSLSPNIANPAQSSTPICCTANQKLVVGVSWSQVGLTNNKLSKMIHGNIRKGYKIGMWNWRRGLIEGDKNPSITMTEVKHFLQNKKLHILCLVESDLHGITSRYKRRHPLSTKDINENLGITRYNKRNCFTDPAWTTTTQRVLGG